MKKYKFKILSGFTMIELLVVIGIIVILMGVSLFGLSGSREQARDAKRKADLETIRSALELYRADCRGYPSSLSFGNSLRGNNSSSSCLSSNVYLDEVPNDPNTSQSYVYRRLTQFSYELCAAIEGETQNAGCGQSCGGVTCTYRVTNP